MSQLRKQIYELSEADLLAHPLWEYCSDEEDVDGQDEATVRPAIAHGLPYGPGEIFVAADATFADGTKATAYISSGPTDELGITQPHVVVEGTQIGFWLG